MLETKKRHLRLATTSNILPKYTGAQSDTIKGLRDLLAATERGEVVGLGYIAITSRGETREGTLGLAATNTALAHYGATRLASILLWPEYEE